MHAVASFEAPGEKRVNIVDEIMSADISSSEKEFKRVFGEVTSVTGAGFETTAGVLRFIFYHLFSSQDRLDRLRNELSSADYGIATSHEFDWKRLEKLPFLSAVIHEGLRLSPATCTRLARISPTEIQYNQWQIPAGTPVGMTILLMHTDPAVWPKPELFTPERWLNPDGTMRKIEHGFAPFSKGTRNCLGMQ